MMRIALFSHCDFLGNSAMHVFNVASELQRLGHRCVIGVPNSPETVLRYKEPSFPVATFEDLLEDCRLGGAPDVLYVWTPREHVRRAAQAFVGKYGCPYVVHMEDNEVNIVENELDKLEYSDLTRLPEALAARLLGNYRAHPRHYPGFIERAAGMTCLIEPLAEFRAEGQPYIVFPPGFEREFASIPPVSAERRAKYGLKADDIVFFYSGNIHQSILHDIRSLYLALVILRRRGHKVHLLKTGFNHADPGISEIREIITDLGFVDRAEVPILLSCADVLVQPGRPNKFNDYRVPSKLPEFLASGRPVLLPDSNIGRLMTDGVEAIKLYEGTASELVEKLTPLMENPGLAAKLGFEGRRFAIEQLSWTNAGIAIEKFLLAIVESRGANPASEPSMKPVKEEKTVSFPAKLVAFYLPQFHPIPENDLWWGKGFTEWTNVGRASNQFIGHSHPRQPSELGYYDLRLPDIFQKQVELAKEYGVYAFCFYFYWFSGKRLLETPLNNWMAARTPDFPFMVCWANENWSRRWDGSEDEILIGQNYSEDDDEKFIRDVIPILKDPRYVRVNDAPVLLVYRVSLLPDPVRTAGAWRRICAEEGVGRIHLCVVQSFGIEDPRPFGFDAAVEFPPPHFERHLITPQRFGVKTTFEGYLEDYICVAARRINLPPQPYVHYRGVTPCWDNTARRKERGHVLVNDSPKAYGEWLRFIAREALLRANQQEPMIFVNAWNEWAEGAYLEPDFRYGRALLEVTREALSEAVIDHLRGPESGRNSDFARRVSRIPKMV